MDLSVLRSFLKVAELGNMTRAAAELHLTQPAVSAQLARLEESLGQQLFDRSTRGMVLNEAGELFRGYAEESLGVLQRGRAALDELSGLRRGSLSIGGGATATTYLLPPLLGRFHAAHPRIQLYVREQGSQSVVEGVASDELDLGVVTRPIDLSGWRIKARLEVQPWLVDELRLIVPPEHPLRAKDAFGWGDLQNLPLVLFEAGSAVRALLDGQMQAAGVQPSIVMELRSIESIKQMVAQGIGAAFVSRFALPDPQQGLACADGPIQRDLAIITRRDRSTSPAAEAFVEMMLRQEAGKI